MDRLGNIIIVLTILKNSGLSICEGAFFHVPVACRCLVCLLYEVAEHRYRSYTKKSSSLSICEGALFHVAVACRCLMCLLYGVAEHRYRFYSKKKVAA